MAKARIIHLDGRYAYAAAGAHKPGDLLTRPDGTFAILDGLEACVLGERISPAPVTPGPIVLYEKDDPADNIAAGTAVYLTSAGEITATATNNTAAGKACQAAGTGRTHILVNPLA